MVRGRTRSEVSKQLPIRADYSFWEREMFFILLLCTLVLFTFTLGTGFVGRKGILVPAVAFAPLIAGAYWRHRRQLRLCRPVVLTESSIESTELDGQRKNVVPWTELKRIEWIQSGPELAGTAGLRVIGATGTVRFYFHIRHFDEIARIVLAEARARGAPNDLPPGAYARLIGNRTRLAEQSSPGPG